MNPEDMNDDELCEAVAVEVLGWEFVDDSRYPYWMMPATQGGPRLCRFVHNGFDLESEILSPDGREAIVQWVISQGWEIDSRFDQIDKTWSYEFSGPDPEASYKNPKGVDGNEHRSIAIAALKAVRGEG